MFTWLSSIWNIFRRIRHYRARKALRDLLLGLNPEIVEEFLELLLRVMSLVLWVDRDYRSNIRNFKGKYLFESKDQKITVCAIFKHSSFFKCDYLDVSEGSLDDADITVTFKNAKALMNLLLSPKLDILGALLRNDVTLKGNINYIFKLGFMATQLQQMLLPGM